MFVLGMLFSAAGLFLVRNAGADAGNRRKKSGDGHLPFLPADGRTVWAVLSVVLFLAGWGRMTMEVKPRPIERYLAEAEKNGGEASGVQRRRMKAVGTLVSYSEKNGYYSMELSDVVLEPSEQEGSPAFQFKEPGLLVSVKARQVELQGIPGCGRKLEICGTAERLDGARNPGGFDAWLYYRGKKISCRFRADELCFPDAEIRPVYSLADGFRRRAKEALAAVCCETDRGIFQAILLGDKSELSEETEALFQENGIAHLLAVSGLHVSLIGMTFYRVLRLLGFGYGSAGMTASIVLLFYGTVTGFGASVFRATGMALAGFLAGWLGRTYDLLSAMALSLFLLAWDSPLLLCSGGLQLSYAAVLAVGLRLEEGQRRKKDRIGKQTGMQGKLADTFFMGLSIQLMTFPILLFHFFEFPVWGVFLNLLVIPLMSYAAASGILGAVLYAGSRCLPVGKVFLLQGAFAAVGPGHYIFQLYRALCSWMGQLPVSSIGAGRPELWKIILYYVVLFFLCRGREKFSRVAFFLAVGLLCTRPVHGLHVWFLDVGQGDCVVLRTSAGAILSDCGSSQEKQVGKRTLVPFLKSQGIRRLKYVLVSHGDADHMNGILWLLEQETDISVEVLGLPLAGAGEEEYRALCEAAEKRKIKIQYLAAGDQLMLGEASDAATFDCIHPGKGEQIRDSNGQSLVFDVNYHGFSLLLTGDIGEEEERGLAEKLFGRYQEKGRELTVLKAAHHGSAGSSSKEFLEAFSPQLAVLSYGEGNSYGHPAPQAVKRLEEAGARLWETAEAGAVHMAVDGKNLKVSGFLLQPVDKK